MTREELRDYVDEQRTLNNIPYHVYSELIDGIDTLGKESCEDAISRHAVLVKIYGSRNNFYNEFDQGFLADKIRELPSVNPQPKIGHWIKVENDQCWWYECDQCHNEPLKDKWTHDDVLSAWCSCCGAKMEVVEE